MEKTSGLILDVYDDINGDVLRSIFPTRDSIPDLVKSASALTHGERGALPDDVHALILVDDAVTLRKFACHDPGSTALSVLYFLKTAHKLPEEAQKVAAENLAIACEWYGLDTPEEIKTAMLGKAMFALQLPGAVGNVKKNISSNMAGIRAAESGAHTVITPSEMQGKHAELSGTSDMPLSAPSPKNKTVLPVKKTASVGRLVDGHKGETASFGPEESSNYDGYTKGKQPAKNPQARLMSPVVHVKGKQVGVSTEKSASITALRGRYPLDSYGDVKLASAYFDEYGSEMSLDDRREYCRNLVKRAQELSIPVTGKAAIYGSDSYATPSVVKIAMHNRASLVADGLKDVALALTEKLAEVSPELFVAAVYEFDKLAGLDRHYGSLLEDPYLSVLSAEKLASDSDWSDVIGNDFVNSDMLTRLAAGGVALLKAGFGEDFAVEFKKDPIGIFKSMPMEQKKVIARLAADDTTTVVRV